MKIGVIGFGNLGQAFVKGVIHKNLFDRSDIYICANSETTIMKAKLEYKVNVSSDINETLGNADIIFFVLKKQVFKELACKIDTKLLENKKIVSFMAGISIEDIQNLLKEKLNIMRVVLRKLQRFLLAA